MVERDKRLDPRFQQSVHEPVVEIESQGVGGAAVGHDAEERQLDRGVVGLDAEGKVVHNLQDADGVDFAKSTSAEQAGDWLYIGSLTEPRWARFDLRTLD